MVGEFESLPGPRLAASLRLFPEDAAVIQAQAFVRDFCEASGFSTAFCDVAVLLIDDLVHKVVVSGELPAMVEIQRAGDGLRIGVRDGAVHIPAQRSSGSGERGVATEVAPRVVWFEIHALR